MKKYIRSILAGVLLFVATAAEAQDSLMQLRREVYISFADLSPLNISLKYKKQIGPKTYFKIGLVSLSAQMSSYNANSGASFPVSNSMYSGGLELGLEWRKAITKKLSLFHGPSLRAVYITTIQKNMNPSIPEAYRKTQTENYTGAIPYTIGLLFQVYNNFHAAVEINPSINGSYQKSRSASNNASSYNGSIGFDNRYALFSFVYRY